MFIPSSSDYVGFIAFSGIIHQVSQRIIIFVVHGSIRINISYRIVSAIYVGRTSRILLAFRVGRVPSDSEFRVHHPESEIDVRYADEYLFLLSVVSVAIVGNKGFGIFPSQAERIVVVGFRRFSRSGIHDGAHAPQMIRHEKMRLDTVRCHDEPASVEPRAFER